MKKFQYFLSLTIITAIALVIVLPLVNVNQTASAQGGLGCTLSADDCALIEVALANAETVTSVNVDELALIMNLDSGDGNPLALSLTGSGPVVVVDGGVSPINTAMTFNGTMTGGEGPENIEGAQLVILDGFGYSFDPEKAIWEGSELASDDMSGLEDLNLAAIIEGLNAFGDIPGAVEWNRGEDMDMGGMGLNVYTVDVHLGTILSSDVAIAAISQLAASTLDDGTTAEDLQFILPMLIGFVSTQLDAGTVQLTLAISPDDQMVHGVKFLTDLTLDLGALASMAGGDESETAPVTILLDMNLNLSQYGESFTIEAPAEWQPASSDFSILPQAAE